MRRKSVLLAQWGFAIAVVGFVSYKLVQQWRPISGHVLSLDIHWGKIALASLLVLCTYVLLIETWRRVLAAWNTTLSRFDATRIWFASSLGKYIPGSIWSITAMGVMAKEQGASGVAAIGSSILVNVLNLASGLVIVLICGSRLLPHIEVFVAVAIASIGAILVAPLVLPRLTAGLCRLTGRDIPLPQIPPATIWISLAGTALAWITYGLSFRLFALGMTGGGSAVLPYVAIYTSAYILGFVVPVPAGLGVREAGIIAGLGLFKLMGPGDAIIVALTSRLWLTILEVAPGLIALAASQVKTHTRHA